jgi:hypothetical protein
MTRSTRTGHNTQRRLYHERFTRMAKTLKIQTLEQGKLAMDKEHGTVVKPASEDARRVVSAMLRRSMKKA